MSNNQFLQLSTGYNGYAELREDNGVDPLS